MILKGRIQIILKGRIRILSTWIRIPPGLNYLIPLPIKLALWNGIKPYRGALNIRWTLEDIIFMDCFREAAKKIFF